MLRERQKEETVKEQKDRKCVRESEREREGERKKEEREKKSERESTCTVNYMRGVTLRLTPSKK